MEPSVDPKSLPLKDLPVELQGPIQGFLQPNKETTKIEMSLVTTKTHVTTSTWLLTVKKAKSAARQSAVQPA
ncbi:hypothetical protein MMC29_006533, partial [Sticta canariensis]|nr:hypothetical protein [Sticta canariensis]